MPLIGANHKEVVRIQAKRLCNNTILEVRNLCVDPQITSFEMLYKLIGKAFNVQNDFVMSYAARDEQGSDVYLTMLSDWDLDAAFFGASDPELRLKIEENPFEEQVDWELLNKQDTVELEKDAFAGMAGPAPKMSAHLGTLRTHMNKTVFQVTKAIGLVNERQDPFSPSKSPMTDSEFRGFLDNVGHLVSPQLFRLSVYQGGVEPALRKVAWRHLLNIYPEGLSGKERHDYLSRKSKEYQDLLASWEKKMSHCPMVQYVHNTVLKDVLRTDRNHPYYSSTGESTSSNSDKLLRLLVTYAVTHPEIAYCQGMSDLASPVLLVEDDEASAYICFCALMQRLRSKFSADGKTIMAGFDDLRLLLRHNDPDFFIYLKRVHADELFFCYRWLILELKREFPLNDVLFLLEVMWSSLPPAPPEDLPLADSDYYRPDHWDILTASSPYLALQSRRKRGGSESCHSDDKLTTETGHKKTVEPSNQAIPSTCSGEKTGSIPSSCSDKKVNEAQNISVETPKTLQVSHDPGIPETSSDTAGSANTGAKKSALILKDDGVTEETYNILDDGTDVDHAHPSIGFINVDEKLDPLPPPEEFGQGNPFLIFLCLTVLLSQRDVILRHRFDYNDLAMLFDKMVRQHDVHRIVYQAKGMYASYLKQQAKLKEEGNKSNRQTHPNI